MPTTRSVIVVRAHVLAVTLDEDVGVTVGAADENDQRPVPLVGAGH